MARPAPRRGVKPADTSRQPDRGAPAPLSHAKGIRLHRAQPPGQGRGRARKRELRGSPATAAARRRCRQTLHSGNTRPRLRCRHPPRRRRPFRQPRDRSDPPAAATPAAGAQTVRAARPGPGQIRTRTPPESRVWAGNRHPVRSRSSPVWRLDGGERGQLQIDRCSQPVDPNHEFSALYLQAITLVHHMRRMMDPYVLMSESCTV